MDFLQKVVKKKSCLAEKRKNQVLKEKHHKHTKELYVSR
jgi:hypothetical protein